MVSLFSHHEEVRVVSGIGSNRARGRERKKQGEENKKLLFPCYMSRGRRRRNNAV
jgi:hypothetical protein